MSFKLLQYTTAIQLSQWSQVVTSRVLRVQLRYEPSRFEAKQKEEIEAKTNTDGITLCRAVIGDRSGTGTADLTMADVARADTAETDTGDVTTAQTDTNQADTASHETIRNYINYTDTKVLEPTLIEIN